jgi:hypothetical protein
MKTKVSNSKVAQQIVDFLKEKGVEGAIDSGHVVVSKDVQKALDLFPFRDWFREKHEDCDCSSCLPPTF